MLKTLGLCCCLVLEVALLECFAAPPVPVIKTSVEEGQEIVAGDIVAFEAGETIDATGFRWAVLPAKFADARPTHEISFDGKSLRLASRPGSYVIILAICNKESEITIIKRDVMVGKVTPGPTPGPVGPINPDPPRPAPKFPDETFGMSAVAYQAASAGTYDKTRLKALSIAFRMVGGAAAAGGFSSLKEIELASVDANRKAICGTVDPNSDEGKAIRTTFLPLFAAMQPKIKELGQREVVLPANYGKMLIEIAVGIEAGSK